MQDLPSDISTARATVQPIITPSHNRILSILSASDRLLLSPHLSDIELKQGALLQEQGETIQYVYFPHSGMISLVAVMNENDESIEVATVGREGTVGAMSGLGPRHAFNRAVVQIGGRMGRIAATYFRGAVKESMTLRDVVVRYNEILLAQYQQSAACNAFHEAGERLARWLLQTRDRIDGDIIPLTQEFLAQMLGVRRTTVTLIARELQDRGLLRYRRGKIEIIDRAGLETRACECYQTVRRQIEEYFPLANR